MIDCIMNGPRQVGGGGGQELLILGLIMTGDGSGVGRLYQRTLHGITTRIILTITTIRYCQVPWDWWDW